MALLAKEFVWAIDMRLVLEPRISSWELRRDIAVCLRTTSNTSTFSSTGNKGSLDEEALVCPLRCFQGSITAVACCLQKISHRVSLGLRGFLMIRFVNPFLSLGFFSTHHG